MAGTNNKTETPKNTPKVAEKTAREEGGEKKFPEIEKKLKEIQSQVGTLGGKIKGLGAEDLEETGAGTPTPQYGPEYEPKGANRSREKLATEGAGAEEMRKWLQEKDKELQKAIAEEKEKTKGILKKITGGPETTRQERLTQLRKEYGIPEKLDKVQEQNIKIAGLKEEMDKLDVKEQQEIDRAHQRRVAMGTIKAQVSEIQRKYDSQRAYLAAELGGEAALMQAYQGNLDQARNLVNESINAWMWDYEERRSRLQALYTHHSDFLDDLKQEQRNIVDRAYSQALRQEKQARADAEWKRERWMRAAEAGITPPSLDQMLEMSKDEVARWYSENVGAVAGEEARAEKEAGWMEFTDQERRRLTQAGIDWTTAEGFKEALDHLYGEEGEEMELTDTQLNKMAAQGLPSSTAKDINKDVSEGYNWDEIYERMKKGGVDPVTAGRYIDVYKKVFSSMGQYTITTQPSVKIEKSYEEKGRREKKGREEEGKGTWEKVKETVIGGATSLYESLTGWY